MENVPQGRREVQFQNCYQLTKITCDLFYRESSTPPLKTVEIVEPIFNDLKWHTSGFLRVCVEPEWNIPLIICLWCIISYVLCIFSQRGFFSLPEGHYFIEPVQNLLDDPAGSPEPHVIYPRAATESHRKKRNVESRETPSQCGVQGVCLNVCEAADVWLIVHM